MAISGLAGNLAQYLMGFGSGGTGQTGTARDTGSAGSGAKAGKNVQTQLTTLLKQAQLVQTQADAAIQSGHRERVQDMASQLSSLVGRVDTQVSAMTSPGVDSSTAKQSKAVLTSILNTVNSTAKELSMLVPRNGSTAATATSTTISDIAGKTASLAKQVGVTLQSTSVSTIASGISSRRPNLVDLLV